MSALFQILLNFLGKAASQLFFHAAFKMTITALFISLVISAVLGYISAYKSIVSGLTATMPEVVAGVWGWVMPSNVHYCITCIVSAVLLRFFTKQWLKLLNYRWKASISN